MDFKAPDVEVSLVSTKDRRVRRLENSEVEEHLNAIAEKD
jgi:hypothetical protein